jgi:hypothetical protein
MRLPRVRFTARRLMVAVVIAAIGLWGIALLRLSAEYRRRASDMRRAQQAHSINAEIAGNVAEAIRREASSYPAFTSDLLPGASKYQRSKEAYQRKADHYSRLTEKYIRAARYPFLPVEPDPPEPE